MQSRATPVTSPRAPLDGVASFERDPGSAPGRTPAGGDARATRGPRVLRGVLAASVATLVALLSHLAGGGGMPGGVGVLVPWVLAVAVCTLLVGRSLSLWRLSLAVVASQSLFHELFILGMFGASAGPSGELHSHHLTAPGNAAPLALSPTDPSASATAVLPALLQADLTMWLGHALAAAATTVALYRGEHAVRRLLALAGGIMHALRTRAAVLAIGIPHVPRRTVPVTADAQVLAPLGWHPSSVARRGPPLLLSV